MSAQAYTFQQVLEKARNYCAYQERCQQELRDKLYELGLHRDEVENGISELISEGFIDEERFARSYARGKFRLKQWGRNKIRYALKQKKISAYCIRKAMSEIDEEEYLQTLSKVAEQKAATIKEKNPLLKSHKIMQYMLARGFEADLIKESLAKKK